MPSNDGVSVVCNPLSTSLLIPLIVALIVPCDGELNAELLNTLSPSFDRKVLLSCSEPDTTPPLRFANKVSPLRIISTLALSDTAKLVLLEISTVFK